MVPFNGVNHVYLRDGKDLTLDFDKNRLAVNEIKKADGVVEKALAEAVSRAAKESAQLLAVGGKQQGETFIHAKAGRSTKETLVVGVHPKLELKLAFNFVMLKNGAGKKALSETRKRSHVTQWIADLNRIFTPQANIVFKQHSIREPSVDRYQGSSIVYKTAEDWSKDVGKVRDKTADSNIFLVGKWKGVGDDMYKDVNGTYIVSTKDIICDDRPSYDLFITTLAHELGHFLSRRRNLAYGHPGPKNSLLVTLNRKDGIKIPKQFVFDFNPRNDGPKVRRN